MAATTMQSTSSTAKQLIADHPSINFVIGAVFRWSSESQTITHPAIDSIEQLYQLLHEVGHAQLNHKDYSSGAELLRMERDAWAYATSVLASNYQIPDSELHQSADNALESYQDWLHQRSLCPSCSAVGIEKTKNNFHCIACRQSWKANDARSCQLRRYKK